jgi:hypothetical protein
VSVKVSEDRVFDLMVELVEFASVHGLPRTAQALEGALDAFLQDRGLAPQALPAPASGFVGAGSGPEAPALAASPDPVAARGAVRAAMAAPDPALTDAAFRTRRPVTQPRRLHLLPSQRVAV